MSTSKAVDMQKKRALISVFDKTNLDHIARNLIDLGYDIIASKGTHAFLKDLGIPSQSIETLYEFEQMLGGRVKTLHPRIHAGLLFDPKCHDVVDNLLTYDVLVINLYDFEGALKSNLSPQELIEYIDIGGPALMRAAAKNASCVLPITSPSDYDTAISDLRAGSLSEKQRFGYAAKAFGITTRYDALVAAKLAELADMQAPLPQSKTIVLDKVIDLPYGENPHQKAAVYKDTTILSPFGFISGEKLQGKDMSYNNYADADNAWRCVAQFDAPACVVVKHASPSGVAIANTLKEAYQAAFATDPISAFGGVIAFNQCVDASAIEAILANQFVEIIVAPDFSADALVVAQKKPRVRIFKIDVTDTASQPMFKSITGGFVLQTPDNDQDAIDQWTCVTDAKASEQTMKDLHFAWLVARFSRSNAIVAVANEKTLGIGSGQPNRLKSASIAMENMKQFNLSASNICVASDAFFPFRDGIDALAAQGANAIVQPGGSIRDQEVIDAANEHGIAMVFTRRRCFYH